jgi:NAD(P)-dependent dehydrogenase (short-subunit alcohol dehydrogenase family)
LRKDRPSVFAALSARVSSISDNRLGGWHSYRASKAALNMIIKGAAIETARTHKKAAVVGLHPGTVDSALSKPFQARVPEGKLFSPEFSAEALINVVENLQAKDTGKLFAWDGQEILP